MRLVLLSTLLLAGCLGGESFRIRDASCDAHFTDWTGGLTYHILQGRGDGSFSYDPRGNVEQDISGSYDLSSGDFEWTVSNAPAHYLTGTEVEGYGYAQTNGDLDILYTSTDTDVLGATRTTEVRTRREGCEVEQLRRVRGAGYDIHHQGTYTKGQYAYEEWVEVGTYSYDFDGVLDKDNTLSGSIVQEDTGYTYTAEHTADYDEGTTRTDWEHDDREDGLLFVGYDETWMDGRKHTHYSFDYEGDTITWDYTVDYGGDSSGTYEQTGLECDVSFEEWSCSMTCSNGKSYDC